ncbi:MAG TPA: hypothetical protein VGH38_11640 [Bryobacteraceae bacterium]
MKTLNSGKAVVVAVGLAVLVMAMPASAQSSMRINIPFAFTAGNETLPAGQYNFVVDSNFSLCHIDSMADGSVHMVRFEPGTSGRQKTDVRTGAVQFKKYGDHYLLTGVFRPGFVDGLATINSRRAIESAKNSGSAAEVVSIDSSIR